MLVFIVFTYIPVDLQITLLGVPIGTPGKNQDDQNMVNGMSGKPQVIAACLLLYYSYIIIIFSYNPDLPIPMPGVLMGTPGKSQSAVSGDQNMVSTELRNS